MALIRLDKFISDSTPLTRKEASKAVRKGVVSVNGNIITDISSKVDIKSDKIIFDGKELILKENYYIMMNKPAGYLSATEDRFCQTVTELLSEDLPKEKIFPAGRLDKDTVGFLFLTTDGVLAHKVTGPKNHVPKKYFVKTDFPIKEEFIKIFKDGIELENGEMCKSADLEIIDDTSCYLTITEGKFHQVKRMFLMLGLTVIYLKRVQIGMLTLDESLKEGEYRELTDDEVLKICSRI